MEKVKLALRPTSMAVSRRFVLRDVKGERLVAEFGDGDGRRHGDGRSSGPGSLKFPVQCWTLDVEHPVGKDSELPPTDCFPC